MKRIGVKKLISGMVVAEDVYSYNDNLILPGGFCLTDEAIAKLEHCSVTSVYIEESEEEEKEEENKKLDKVEEDKITIDYENFSPEFAKEILEQQAFKESEEFKTFEKQFNDNVKTLKNCLCDVVEKNSPIKVDEMLQGTLSMIKTCRTASDVFTMLQNMRTYDDLTFTHSLNVALICNVFAQWLKFSKEEQELVTECGLFHDIGKLAIPEEIVKKPSKLTNEEYSIIKKHPVEGYNILKKQDISVHIKNSALMHHERCDGGGYPLGIKGDKIDKFAKVVAIADVYDAMTAARVYRGPLCPISVIELYEREGLQKYETQYILTFLEQIVNTYTNSYVQLSNGEIGKIVLINKSNLSKPTIATDKEIIDLAKTPDVKIERII